MNARCSSAVVPSGAGGGRGRARQRCARRPSGDARARSRARCLRRAMIGSTPRAPVPRRPTASLPRPSRVGASRGTSCVGAGTVVSAWTCCACARHAAGSGASGRRRTPRSFPPLRGLQRGERGDSNPRPPGPQPGALPAELRPPRVRIDAISGGRGAPRRGVKMPAGQAIRALDGWHPRGSCGSSLAARRGRVGGLRNGSSMGEPSSSSIRSRVRSSLNATRSSTRGRPIRVCLRPGSSGPATSHSSSRTAHARAIRHLQRTPYSSARVLERVTCEPPTIASSPSSKRTHALLVPS